jgi:hypothetical protein
LPISEGRTPRLIDSIVVSSHISHLTTHFKLLNLQLLHEPSTGLLIDIVHLHFFSENPQQMQRDKTQAIMGSTFLPVADVHRHQFNGRAELPW